MTRLEFGATTLCRWCAGSGRVNGRPCAACGGVGFSGRPPSNGDPNSDEAADAIAATAGKKRAEVLAAIVARGGATEREIEEATGLGGNTVRPRLVELERDGAIRKAGRVKNENGRSVWRYERAA